MFFEKNKVIKKIVCINGTKLNAEKAFHIAYGIDRNFLFGAAISITSIIINNLESHFSFHIFTDYIDDDYILRAKKLCEKFNTLITIYLINTDCLSELPSHKWPLATYFRFIIFDLLSEDINSLLYLDADIVCKGPINDIIELDLNSYFAAVVPDILSMQSLAVERLEENEIYNNYFNAGFLYINLIEWKKNKFTERAMSLLTDPIKGKKLKYQDQDALNILFFKKTILLPRKFNCIYSIKDELKDKTHEKYKNIITDGSVFIHYVGATKPWHSWGQYLSTIYFQHAYHESTWHDVPLIQAITPSQWKEKSKHEFAKLNVAQSIISRMIYFFKKYVLK
ncbi:glycosyltransferase [Pectobacterium cacticida]|uniref:glycosyltransferase n=1 Tax=Pectobacterium cacticida TaxID=69221 RepID=UPI002FF0B448